tara:strand:+ start:1020 stop:2003 length:984 start_codon:yes stop_codon:yes gene_type:complete
MESKYGIFTVSLDFELYWGVRDKRTIEDYEKNLEGAKKAIEVILEVFEEYEVHATWATVGFLFAKDSKELGKMIPLRIPSYNDINLNPYQYIEKNNFLEPSYHFAPNLIKKIHDCENQEIGTHTFSHYYCLEEGQNIEEFNNDIEAAVAIAQKNNIPIKSLVFPRNQLNPEYLSVLNKHGIDSYRGNEQTWSHKASDSNNNKFTKRVFRFLDSYINLTGSNTFSLSSIKSDKPYEIQSSCFLRPTSKKFALIEGLKKRRITNSLTKAAKECEIFHLWWHPHNFGINTDENIEILREILSCYKDMRSTYGMKSLNMGEISNLISEELA